MSASAPHEPRKLTRRDRGLVWLAFLGPPAAWTAHLLVGYGWEEYACATGEATAVTEPLIVAATAALALVTIACGLAAAWSMRAAGRGEIDDPRGRIRFIGFAGLLGSFLFLLVIVLGGVQLVALDPCRP